MDGECGRNKAIFTNPRGLDLSLQREGNDEHIVGSRPSAKKGANCATTIFIVPSLNVVNVQFLRALVFGGSTIVILRWSEVGESIVENIAVDMELFKTTGIVAQFPNWYRMRLFSN